MHITKKPRPPVVRGVEPINDTHDITFTGGNSVYLNLYDLDGTYGPKDVRALQDSIAIELDDVKAVAEALLRVACQIETGEIAIEDDANEEGDFAAVPKHAQTLQQPMAKEIDPWWKASILNEGSK